MMFREWSDTDRTSCDSDRRLFATSCLHDPDVILKMVLNFLYHMSEATTTIYRVYVPM